MVGVSRGHFALHLETAKEMDNLAQDRLKELLGERDTACTLRKQPQHLTDFFYARLKEFSLLVTHPEALEDPRRGLIARLWTFLRFIGKPNDIFRKEDIIKNDWAKLSEDLKEFS